MPFYSSWLKQLANIEISSGFLWIAGLTFVFVFSLLLREVASWLVKQHEIKEEIESLRTTVESLRNQITKLNDDLNRESVRVETRTAFPIAEEFVEDEPIVN